MIGTQIGCYQVLEKLGEGGMGVVYRAVDTNLERPVAIKVLSADFSKNPDLVTRFRAEAKAQANLNHTNLTTLYAFMVQDGVAYMIMELIDGQSFDQMIRNRGPIPEGEAIPLFRQALLGIGYAHRAGILHRDIKPNNLMLNKNGIVKVMDFGISKVMGSRGLTKTGTQMGTVAYMSPEQIKNGPVDIRSDIYELGVTLYEMLSGHLPFESESDFQIMQDHVATPPPLPTRYYPYISKGVEAVLLKSLEKNPDARFQTVEEFGAALEHPESLGFAAPALTRGTVLESPSFAEKLAEKTQAAGAATIANSATVASYATVVSASSQRPGTKPPAAASSQKWIFAGVGVLLAAIIAVAVYRTVSPVDGGGSGAAGGSTSGSAPPPSVKSILAESAPPLAATDPQPAQPGTSQPGPAVAPVLKLNPTPAPAAKPRPLTGDEMLGHAQTALAQQRYFEPYDNSALYWTIRARKAGNPSASALETEIQGVYKKQMLAYYQQKNYPAALALLNGMLRYYPDNPSLLAERSRIQEAISTRR